MKRFVGRENAAAHLASVLRGETKSSTGPLSILSIEGPGGIGKTSFFDHVLAQTDLDDRNYLVMRIGGNGESRHSARHAIHGLMSQATGKHLPAKAVGAYFPSLTDALTAYDQFHRAAIAEFENSGVTDTPGEMISMALDVLVGLGKPINKLLPKTAEYVNVELVAEHRESIQKALNSLATLKDSETGFLERLGMDSAATLRTALKHNALKVFSDRMFNDLTAILAGYESKDFFSPKLAKLPKVDRLLLVIDDYEAVKESLERFLVDHLFVSLKDARFETTAVLIGRDRLADTSHNDWQRQLGGALLEPISVRALERSEMDELCRANGVIDAAEQDRAWSDTAGYPFFVQLWLEETQAGGRTAMLLKRAYERTTKWMNGEQRRWLAHALVLDSVDVRQFRLILGDETEARRAFEWFQNDPSVRDPHSATFRVREYLRSRLLDYIKLSDPDQYDDLICRRDAGAATGADGQRARSPAVQPST